MSREEAATIYLDALLGFKCDYQKFCLSQRILSQEEMALLQEAVSGWTRDDDIGHKDGE